MEEFKDDKINLKYVVEDVLEKDKVIKTKARKLKLNPTQEQKKILNEWAGSVRFIYNTTIATLTNPKNKTQRLNEFKLKKRFSTVKNQKTGKRNNFYNNKAWLEDCLSSVRKCAVLDAKSNLSSCFTNLKNKNIDHFTSPFRTKKKEILNGYSFSIEKKDIKKDNNALIIAKLDEICYHSTKQLHKLIKSQKPEHDCKIQKSKFNEYFLIIPYEVKSKLVPKIFKNPISIDPGVRKNFTTYAPNERTSYILGDRWTSNLMEALLPLDKLYSQRSKKNYKNIKEKSLLKERILKLRKRVYYLKKDFKDRTANFLSKNYDLILMPKLKTQDMCIKAERRLKTKTVRAMLSIGHSKIFDAVKHKCWERGKKFLDVEESYTSQTCPNCGQRHKTSLEVYRCNDCGFTYDRDVIGALNILLKALAN
jgi:putative transposase